MKTSLIKIALVLLGVCNLLTAQEKNYTQKMDSLMQFVDKSQMTTDILYDRVFSFTDIDSDVPQNTNYEYFVQLWSEMHRASHSPNFVSAETLQDMVKQNVGNSNIKLGIINLKYNYIDYGTDDNPNLVFENGYFRNVQGRNPFREKEVSLVVPLVEKITTSQVSFSLNENLIAQNPNATPISGIQVDFGNGNIQTISLSNGGIAPYSTQKFSTQYTTNGIKNIHFKILYANGTHKNISHKIEVQAFKNTLVSLSNKNNNLPSNYELFLGVNGITQTTPFKGYNENTTRSGRLEYGIFYKDATKRLYKPIIVLDGYDPRG